MQDFAEINTNYIALLIQSAMDYDARFNTNVVTISVPSCPVYYVKFWNLKRTNQIMLETAPSRVFETKINLTLREFRKLEALGWKKKFWSTVYKNKISIQNEDQAGVLAMEVYTILVEVFGHQPKDPVNINTYLKFNHVYIYIFDTVMNIKTFYYDSKRNVRAIYSETMSSPVTKNIITKSIYYSKVVTKKVKSLRAKYFK